MKTKLILLLLFPALVCSQTFDSSKVSYVVEYKKIDSVNSSDTTLVFADSLDLTISWDAVISFGSPSDSLIRFDGSSGWIVMGAPKSNELRKVIGVKESETYSFRVWSVYDYGFDVKSLAPSPEYMMFVQKTSLPPAAISRKIKLKI